MSCINNLVTLAKCKDLNFIFERKCIACNCKNTHTFTARSIRPQIEEVINATILREEDARKLQTGLKLLLKQFDEMNQQ